MQLDINYKELALLREILREMKGDFFKVWYKRFLLTDKTKAHLDPTLYDRWMAGEFLEEATEDVKSCFSLLSKIDKIEEELQKEME